MPQKYERMESQDDDEGSATHHPHVDDNQKTAPQLQCGRAIGNDAASNDRQAEGGNGNSLDVDRETDEEATHHQQEGEECGDVPNNKTILIDSLDRNNLTNMDTSNSPPCRALQSQESTDIACGDVKQTNGVQEVIGTLPKSNRVHQRDCLELILSLRSLQKAVKIRQCLLLANLGIKQLKLKLKKLGRHNLRIRANLKWKLSIELSRRSSLMRGEGYQSAQEIECLKSYIVHQRFHIGMSCHRLFPSSDFQCPNCFRFPIHVWLCHYMKCKFWVCDACRMRLRYCPKCSYRYRDCPPTRDKALEAFFLLASQSE